MRRPKRWRDMDPWERHARMETLQGITYALCVFSIFCLFGVPILVGVLR